MKEIKTDKLLVDVAIQIKPGKTYWGLGYEDTLMILPDRSRFNPTYIQEFKGQLKQILDLAFCSTNKANQAFYNALNENPSKASLVLGGHAAHRFFAAWNNCIFTSAF